MDGPSLAPPYLVLLRAGFGLPLVLPRARCALTAPFHPYSPSLETRSVESEGGRYVFCATFLRVAPTGCYPAHCPAEFGLSSSSCDETAVWLTATGSILSWAGGAGGAGQAGVGNPGGSLPALPAFPALPASGLAVRFLGNLVLLQFLVKVAAG